MTDPNTAAMILNRSGILTHDVVLEIGAGLGALTIPLAHMVKQVYAVEKDRRILDILKTEILVNNLANVVCLEKDILNFDIQELAQKSQHKIIVMGNLPYNISSQVLVQLVKFRKTVSRAILMFQKEVADRIVAKPKTKDFGRLSVLCNWRLEIKKHFDVSKNCFSPKPKINSTVLSFKPKKNNLFNY